MNFRPSRGGVHRAAVVLDVTALVDVVFQLLIFFILTSSYVAQQQTPASARVPVELPESSLASDAPAFEDIIVTVDSEGRTFVGDEEITSMEELVVRLTQVAARNPKTVLLIRGDQNVPYGRIAQVMAVARAAGLPVSAVLKGGG